MLQIIKTKSYIFAVTMLVWVPIGGVADSRQQLRTIHSADNLSGMSGFEYALLDTALAWAEGIALTSYSLFQGFPPIVPTLVGWVLLLGIFAAMVAELHF